MTKPISPNDIASYKANSFPPYVFEAFNELIAEKFTAGSANVKQNDVIARILAKANAGISNADLDEEFGGYGKSLSRAQIFDRGYLNVEEVYRAEGWKVGYDKPAYYETYEASFTFKAK